MLWIRLYLSFIQLLFGWIELIIISYFSAKNRVALEEWDWIRLYFIFWVGEKWNNNIKNAKKARAATINRYLLSISYLFECFNTNFTFLYFAFFIHFKSSNSQLIVSWMRKNYRTTTSRFKYHICKRFYSNINMYNRIFKTSKEKYFCSYIVLSIECFGYRSNFKKLQISISREIQMNNFIHRQYPNVDNLFSLWNNALKWTVNK